jgi:hypothetical protein
LHAAAGTKTTPHRALEVVAWWQSGQRPRRQTSAGQSRSGSPFVTACCYEAGADYRRRQLNIGNIHISAWRALHPGKRALSRRAVRAELLGTHTHTHHFGVRLQGACVAVSSAALVPGRSAIVLATPVGLNSFCNAAPAGAEKRLRNVEIVMMIGVMISCARKSRPSSATGARARSSLGGGRAAQSACVLSLTHVVAAACPI